MMCYNTIRSIPRPLGQAAKTTPSHGVIMGSIPVGVTKKHPNFGSDVFLSKPQAWYGINALAHCTESP